MPRFNYVALDSRGQESAGLIDASSSSEAIGQLRQAGYFPTNVAEEGKSDPRAPKPVKAKGKTKAVAVAA
ncbi:MAG: type II secretion system F family protein, partial [Verrucomicrobiota bacterium]|nr:type II secretion system F family protein [Verrucomicrobiota bacterium]